MLRAQRPPEPQPYRRSHQDHRGTGHYRREAHETAHCSPHPFPGNSCSLARVTADKPGSGTCHPGGHAQKTWDYPPWGQSVARRSSNRQDFDLKLYSGFALAGSGKPAMWPAARPRPKPWHCRHLAQVLPFADPGGSWDLSPLAAEPFGPIGH